MVGPLLVNQAFELLILVLVCAEEVVFMVELLVEVGHYDGIGEDCLVLLLFVRG